MGIESMTGEQLKGESSYRVSMTIAKSMFKRGLITSKEYAKIDTIMKRKYRPIIGSL